MLRNGKLASEIRKKSSENKNNRKRNYRKNKIVRENEREEENQ